MNSAKLITTHMTQRIYLHCPGYSYFLTHTGIHFICSLWYNRLQSHSDLAEKPDESVFVTAFYFTLIFCCVVKVCAKTVGVFCGVTSDGLAPVTGTRPLRVWSTEQRPLRTGGNTSAAVLLVEEESHQWSACLLTRCGNNLQESWLYITKFKVDVVIRW